MKIRCPYCGTKIQKEAVYCRYCKHTIESPASTSSQGAGEPAPKVERYQKLGKRWMYIFLGLIGFYVVACLVASILTNRRPENFIVDESNKSITQFPGQITYASDGNIYVMNGSSSALTQLTFRQEEEGYYEEPILSPDGSHVAFLRSKLHTSSSKVTTLFLAEIASGEVRQITTSEGSIRYLDWSADSTRLLFIENLSENNIQTLYVFDIPTGELEILLTEDIFAQFDGARWHPENPQWSPDSTKILLSVDWGKQLVIYSLVDEQFTEIASELAEIQNAVWSPDGSRIAFSAYTQYDNETDIYIANADGTNIVRVTDNLTNDAYPQWSPDGKKILFTAYRDRGHNTLSVIGTQPEIQEETVIPGYPNNEYEFENPVWSPDSNSILFEHRPRSANSLKISLIDLETMKIQQLCDACFDPFWQ